MYFGGGFSDLFEGFFGGGFGGSNSRRRGPTRGNDLRYNMAVNLQEAFSGKKLNKRVFKKKGSVPEVSIKKFGSND